MSPVSLSPISLPVSLSPVSLPVSLSPVSLSLVFCPLFPISQSPVSLLSVSLSPVSQSSCLPAFCVSSPAFPPVSLSPVSRLPVSLHPVSLSHVSHSLCLPVFHLPPPLTPLPPEWVRLSPGVRWRLNARRSGMGLCVCVSVEPSLKSWIFMTRLKFWTFLKKDYSWRETVMTLRWLIKRRVTNTAWSQTFLS